MMEVKQNTAVDLNELLVPPKSAEGVDELDDAIMADLSDETASQDLNCDLIKSNAKINNGLSSAANEDDALSSLIDIDSSEAAALDDDIPVTTELEDALLAEDNAGTTDDIEEEEALLAEDVPVSSEIEEALLAEDDGALPDLNESKIVNDKSPSLTEDDLLADKVETSNSTTISSTDRDPGDDLDTLLSKINDIVDDCLDNEPTTTGVIPPPEVTEEKNVVEEKQEKENSNENEKEKEKEKEKENEKETEKEKEKETEYETEKQNEKDAKENEKENEKLNEKEKENERENEMENENESLNENVNEKEIENVNEKEIENEKDKNIDLSTSCVSIDESVVLIEDDPTLEETDIENDATEAETTLDLKKIDSPQAQPIAENTTTVKDDETEMEKNTTQLDTPDKSENCEISKEEDLIENSTDDIQIIEDVTETKTETETCKEQQQKDEDKPAEKEVEEPFVISAEKEEEEPKESTTEDVTNIIDNSLKPNETDETALSNGAESEKDDLANNKNDASTDDLVDEQFNQKEHTPESFANKDTEEASPTKDEVKEDTAKSEKECQEPKKDIEESDDDIVFFEDEKHPESEKEKNEQTEKDTEDSQAKQVNDDTAVTPAADDDDVVILDDDDEDMDADAHKNDEEPKPEEAITSEKIQAETNEAEDSEKSKSVESKETNKEAAPQESTQINVDNSDNACENFVSEKEVPEPETTTDATPETSAAEIKTKIPEIDEIHSNCSSSSNLLLEAKTNENSVDGGNQEDHENENENEEDEDDGDVELIENETKESENSLEKADELAPPAKRPRLSEDSQVSLNVDDVSNKSQNVPETVEGKTEKPSDEAAETISPSLKRSHDVVELELDDKSNDSITKKARTDETSQKEDISAASTDVKEEKKPIKEETETASEDKLDIKNMIPSYKPIALYPPPNLESLKSEKTLSLDFLKKYRKSFDTMTKQDLEEMVLQKVVEAIIHKSEFADMRELIEKQEKLIASHRTKISELSKQFRDLEMVHNRVVKDIEQRNSQFIMPVKITRAVGLQVYIPNKKSILESGTTTGNNALPSVSPQRPQSSAATSNSTLTSPQRPMASVSSHTVDIPSRSNSTLSSAVNANITNAVRRGCAQKITPTRPVPNSNSSSAAPSNNSANSAGSAYRSSLNQTPPTQPRILNKNATQPSTAGAATSTANNAASNMQRNRFASSNMDNIRLPVQPPGSRPVANNQRIVQQKPSATPVTVVPRRPETGTSSTTSSNNTPSLDNYMNTLSQLTGGNTAVSITPAKPKEKAVIDLTDEDEIAPPTSSAANSPANTSTTNNGPATTIPPQRRILPAPNNNTNSTSQFARNAPPLARIPPINQVSNANKNRQTSAQQGQKSNNSTYSSPISTPAGTSITRINVSANNQTAQRPKYNHPAPLPATPPQAFNHSWKLPPPRPTIRISNLNNGIVISWTMEESMDRHAECVSYQIYAYQETTGPPLADSWRHVGDVKAMLLPMAVTLTQFQEGQRYFFAVRAVDCHQRYGPFSLPKTWS